MPRQARVVIASIVVFVGVTRAVALTGPDERCQQAIAGSGLKLLGRSAAILAACGREIARGHLPAGTDCLADPATAQARDAAATKALASVGALCSDGSVMAIAPAGDCRGAATVADVSACLRATHDAEAVTLSAIVDAVPGPLSAATRTCKLQASGQVRRVAR